MAKSALDSWWEQEVMDVKADINISRSHKLPMAKLTVSGKLKNFSVDGGDKKAAQRAIVFVVDRSGSMKGNRIDNCRDVLKSFVEQNCQNETLLIKLVMFDDRGDIYDIPRDQTQAGAVIQAQVKDKGGTNFHEASKGLVTAATKILDENPTFQLTVIMCSDGEVSKDNALQGHKHWKDFVNQKYLKKHKTMPYVETIGIGANHDADVLIGFILDDEFGNYVRCEDNGIVEAYTNANKKTLERDAGDVDKVKFNFPINVYDGIAKAKEKGTESKEHEIIVKEGAFSQEFWIPIEDVDGDEKEQLSLTVNGEKIEIEVNDIQHHDKDPRLDYYESTLTDMLQNLRDITDGNQLKTKATEFQKEINGELTKQFDAVSAEFKIEEEKLKRTVKAFCAAANSGVDINDLEDDDLLDPDDFDKMRSIWKEYKEQVKGSRQKLEAVKKLVSEIVSGKMDNKKMRQRILDLHFSIIKGDVLDDGGADQKEQEKEDDSMDMMLALVDGAMALRDGVKTSSVLYQNAETECKDNTFADFTFLIGEKRERYPIGKIIFAMHSPYFAGILYDQKENEDGNNDEEQKEKPNEYVEEDLKVTPVAFSVVKQYFYQLKVEIDMHNVCEIWYAASKYGIVELEDQCEKLIDKAYSRKDIDFILFVESSAVQMELDPDHSMRVRFKEWLTADRCLKMINSEAFLSVCKELVVGMLQNESFEVSEETMWTRCKEWCKKRALDDEDGNSLEWTHLMKSHFMEHIGFAKMPPKFFKEQVFPSGVMEFEEAFEVMVWLNDPNAIGSAEFRKTGGRGYGGRDNGGGMGRYSLFSAGSGNGRNGRNGLLSASGGSTARQSLFAVHAAAVHQRKKENLAESLQYELSQSTTPKVLYNSYTGVTNNNLNEGVATASKSGEWVMAKFDTKKHLLRMDLAACYADDWSEKDLNKRQIQYKDDDKKDGDDDQWVDWQVIKGIKKNKIHVMNLDIHTSAVRIISIFSHPVVIGCWRFYGHDDSLEEIEEAIPLKWDRKRHGKDLEFVDDERVKCPKTACWALADYVARREEHDTFEWTVKVHQYSNSSHMGFVNAAKVDEMNMNEYLAKTDKVNQCAVLASLNTTSLSAWGDCKASSLKTTIPAAKVGDVFKFVVDFGQKEVALYLNDKFLGIYFKNVYDALIPVVSNVGIPAEYTISGLNERRTDGPLIEEEQKEEEQKEPEVIEKTELPKVMLEWDPNRKHSEMQLSNNNKTIRHTTSSYRSMLAKTSVSADSTKEVILEFVIRSVAGTMAFGIGFVQASEVGQFTVDKWPGKDNNQGWSMRVYGSSGAATPTVGCYGTLKSSWSEHSEEWRKSNWSIGDRLLAVYDFTNSKITVSWNNKVIGIFSSLPKDIYVAVCLDYDETIETTKFERLPK